MTGVRVIALLGGLLSSWVSFGQPTCPVEGSAVIDAAYNPMAKINDLITSHPDQTYQVEGIELFSTGESIVSLRTFEFGIENQSKTRMVKFNADGTIQCFVFGCISALPPARKFLVNDQQHVVLARDDSEGGFRLLIVDGAGNSINEFPANTNAVGDIVYAIEYQPDGKVVVSHGFDNKVRRINANGTVDSSFPTLNLEARVIRRQPDGKLLIGGNFPGGLIRVLPNGISDPAFQNNNVMGIVNDLVTLPDGKILIVGAFNAVGGFQRNSIALLNADGSTDSSFDSGTGIGLDNNHFIKWVKRMANGKFLIGGTFATYNDIARSGLAMVNTDGSLDCYFKAPQPLSGLVDDAVEQADGKIILTGSFVEYGGVTRKGMVRITPGGPLIPPSGLRLWLRADDLNLPNNAPVSAWNDASGAGNHFGIGGSGAPVYKAACPGVLNGKPYITWNGPGVTSWFARNDALGMAPNTPRTYIAVYRLFNTSARSFVLQHGNFSTPGTYHGIDANTFLTQGNRFGVYSTNSSFDSDRSTDGLFHIQYRSASTMAVNADIINDTEYRTNDTLRILTRRSGNGFYESFAGANEFRIGGWIEIAEVIVYDRTLSESERIGIHNYLRNKYGNFPITPAPAPPTISSFSPASAAPGATVTISGSDFTGVTNVSFGGVPATSFTVVSATTITATVPTGATSGRITVNTACNAATSDIDFAVLAGPLFPSVSFAQTASRATGPTPREVLMSDLNGDGFLDVATSLVGSGQLQVFNGTGAGCFNATQNFPTLADGHGLAIDDFNADGRPDVAVSSPNQNQLAVLLNSPTGLQAPTIYTTGAAGALPRHINTGDINGDARPDIVVANSTSPGRFSILYNLGAGVFAAGVDFSTSQGTVYFVSIADFNRDGRQDVVMANFFFGSVSIFINDGAGSFLTERVITLRNGTHFVVARDLNGDGAPDIAAANASNNSVSVLLNQGDGNFLTPVHYATGGYPTSIAVGDLHNDGSLDLTVAHAFGGSFGVLPGNGLGEFGPRQDFSVSGQPYSVALGDITGDGFLDVVATDLSGNRLNFYLSSAFAAPAAPTVTPATACAGTSATLVASGGSTGQYRWYTDATGPTQIPGEVNSNLVTSPLTTTTTFFVALRTGVCESSRTPVTATVIATPAPPAANPVSSCTGTAATLTASGGTAGQYRWYTQATGGTPLAGENNAGFTTPQLTSNTTYHVSINNGTCESGRTAVAVTVRPLPADPTPVGSSRCGSGSVTISATGAGAGQYRWYLSSSGGLPIPNETNGTYTISSLAATTTYFVAVNNGECESGRIAVTATIDPVPAAPSTTPASRCGPGSITLSASGGSTGQYRWYTQASGGTALPGAVNSTFSTTTAGIVYVSVVLGQCESSRTPAEAKILDVPAVPVVTSSVALVNNQIELCPTASATLTAPAGFAAYIWSTGSSGPTATVTQAGTVTLIVRNAEGCTSAPGTVTVVSRTCSPAIASPPAQTIPVEGTLTLNVATLITSILPIVPGSLRVKVPPRSGATATVSSTGELQINYSGVLFAGMDQVTIEVCNVAGECGSQVISIDVVGDIVVYNGISPNGDGQNDYFYIQYIDILPAASENRVLIFNRWGDRVWQTTNYNNTSNRFEGLSDSGGELPSGTYFYRIQFASGVPERSGYLTIRR